MITYDAGGTEQAVKFFENNLDFIGTVRSIEHEVLNDAKFYKTTIKGSEETLVINNALTSGFSGEGPRGLKRVLERLGVESIDAQFYTGPLSYGRNGFTINF